MQFPAEARLRPPLLPGELPDLALHLLPEPGQVHPRLLEDGHGDRVLLGQERGEEMRVVDDGVPPPAGVLARFAEGVLAAEGESFGSQHRMVPFRRGACVPDVGRWRQDSAPRPKVQGPFRGNLPQWQNYVMWTGLKRSPERPWPLRLR